MLKFYYGRADVRREMGDIAMSLNDLNSSVAGD